MQITMIYDSVIHQIVHFKNKENKTTLFVVATFNQIFNDIHLNFKLIVFQWYNYTYFRTNNAYF